MEITLRNCVFLDSFTAKGKTYAHILCGIEVLSIRVADGEYTDLPRYSDLGDIDCKMSIYNGSAYFSK